MVATQTTKLQSLDREQSVELIARSLCLRANRNPDEPRIIGRREIGHPERYIALWQRLRPLVDDIMSVQKELGIAVFSFDQNKGR